MFTGGISVTMAQNLDSLLQAERDSILMSIEKNQAQQNSEDLPYKSLVSFKSNAQMSDTLQYLEYNFLERRDQYKGKKVSDVVQDIELPANTIVETSSVDGRLIYIALGITQFNDQPNVFKDYYVVIAFVDRPRTADLREVFGWKNKEMTSELYKKLKDLEVAYVSANPYLREARKANKD